MITIFVKKTTVFAKYLHKTVSFDILCKMANISAIQKFNLFKFFKQIWNFLIQFSGLVLMFSVLDSYPFERHYQSSKYELIQNLLSRLLKQFVLRGMHTFLEIFTF